MPDKSIDTKSEECGNTDLSTMDKSIEKNGDKDLIVPLRDFSHKRAEEIYADHRSKLSSDMIVVGPNSPPAKFPELPSDRRELVDCYAFGWPTTTERLEVVMAFGCVAYGPDADALLGTSNGQFWLFSIGRESLDKICNLKGFRLFFAANEGEYEVPQDHPYSVDSGKGRQMMAIAYAVGPNKLRMPPISQAVLDWLQNLLGPAYWYKTMYGYREWHRHGLD